MRVELIYDVDCPNISLARRRLLEALAKSTEVLAWTEWNRHDPNAPAYVRHFGSLTILMDGVDLNPQRDATAARHAALPSRSSESLGYRCRKGLPGRYTTTLRGNRTHGGCGRLVYLALEEHPDLPGKWAGRISQMRSGINR